MKIVNKMYNNLINNLIYYKRKMNNNYKKL